jgi:hypothetical protein
MASDKGKLSAWRTIVDVLMEEIAEKEVEIADYRAQIIHIEKKIKKEEAKDGKK